MKTIFEYYLFILLLSFCIISSCDDNESNNDTPNVPTNTPPQGSEYMKLPEGSSFDFSTGTVDDAGQSGDFSYINTNINGIPAPSGVSWWEGSDINYFISMISNQDHIPPAEGWGASSGTGGSSGKGTRWLKTEEGRYAIIFSVNATQSNFEFYYLEPYGNFEWSDTEKPNPPLLITVETADVGELLVNWQHSTSSDVEGYWVSVGEIGNSVGKHAGYTTNYTLVDLNSGQLYYVWVNSYDEEGNASDDSNVLTGTPN